MLKMSRQCESRNVNDHFDQLNGGLSGLRLCLDDREKILDSMQHVVNALTATRFLTDSNFDDALPQPSQEHFVKHVIPAFSFASQKYSEFFRKCVEDTRIEIFESLEDSFQAILSPERFKDELERNSAIILMDVLEDYSKLIIETFSPKLLLMMIRLLKENREPYNKCIIEGAREFSIAVNEADPRNTIEEYLKNINTTGFYNLGNYFTEDDRFKGKLKAIIVQECEALNILERQYDNRKEQPFVPLREHVPENEYNNEFLILTKVKIDDKICDENNIAENKIVSEIQITDSSDFIPIPSLFANSKAQIYN